MSIESLINKITRFFLHLYYRHWNGWELLTIALVALLLVLLLLRAQQKRKAMKRNGHVYASVIGKKLTEKNQQQQI